MGEPAPNPAGFLLLALTLIGVAVTVSHRLYDGSDEGFAEVVERSSDFPLEAVRRCLKPENGGQVFGHYKSVHPGRAIAMPRSAVRLFIASDRSRLYLARKGRETMVSIKSVEPISAEQLDLIERCVERPRT